MFVRKSNLKRNAFRAVREYFQVTAFTEGNYRTKKYGSLKSMEEKLEGCYFLRIHKNYLVN